MRVALSIDAIEHPGHERAVIELLSVFIRGRHDLVIADPQLSPALRGLLDAHLSGSVRTDYLELVEKFEVASVWDSGDPPSVTVDRSSIDDLLADLAEPARVVVEDLVSDGAFIRALAQALGAPKLARGIELGQLEIVHAGGKGRVKQLVAASLRRFRILKPVVAVVDSDRLKPAQDTYSHRLADELRTEFNIYTCVLEYREAENYVPNRCIAMTGSGRPFAHKMDAFTSLSTEQRAYFDVKNGFPIDSQGAPLLADVQQELYSDIPIGTVRLLCTGFGSSILQHFELHAANITKNDISSLGESVLVELKDLLCRLEDLV